MDLSIVIVNYNTKKLLVDCIESILDSDISVDFEVCVVDNNSYDQSFSVFLASPRIKFILNKKNNGYSVANNIAIQNTTGKYILLLNPDTRLYPGSVDLLISRIEADEAIGAVGPKLIREDGSLDKACRRSFPTPSVWFYHSFGLGKLFPKNPKFNSYNLDHIDPDLEMEVDSLVGACMLVRREAFEMVGGFDERFFLYGEDLDLCLRMKNNGWAVWYFPNAVITHYKGRSTSLFILKSTVEFYRSMYLFHLKHYFNNTNFLLNILIIVGIAFLFFLKIIKLSWIIFRQINLFQVSRR